MSCGWASTVTGSASPARAALGSGPGRPDRVDQVIERVGATAYAAAPHRPGLRRRAATPVDRSGVGHRPRLLLLDEPLDSLDLPNQATVAALIGQICADGVAVMLVAHDVNPILGYLDRVIYLARRRGAWRARPTRSSPARRSSTLYDTPIEVLYTRDGRPVVVGQPEAPGHHHDRHG